MMYEPFSEALWRSARPASSTNDNSARPSLWLLKSEYSADGKSQAEREAYVSERVARCCEILSRPPPPPPPLEIRWPRRRRHPNQRAITALSFAGGWVGFTLQPGERISYRSTGPLPPLLNGLPAMPLDNWPANTEAFRDFECCVEYFLDDVALFDQAAE